MKTRTSTLLSPLGRLPELWFLTPRCNGDHRSMYIPEGRRGPSVTSTAHSASSEPRTALVTSWVLHKGYSLYLCFSKFSGGQCRGGPAACAANPGNCCTGVGAKVQQS